MNIDKMEHFMALALAESKNALPRCLPNPPVGCIFVKDDKIVSKGFTQAPGSDHAEAMALRLYGNKPLQEVSVFVTLEPCSFQGRTPSCALTLISKRPKEVIVAIIDPHPKNCGAGIRLLRKAGIPVEVGISEDPVFEFIQPYLSVEQPVL
jgi:pyrimidine deaminase RibD-like protein